MVNLTFINGIYNTETREFDNMNIIDPELDFMYNQELLDYDVINEIKTKLFYNNLGLIEGHKLINYLKNAFLNNKATKILVFEGLGNNGKTFLKQCIRSLFTNFVSDMSLNVLMTHREVYNIFNMPESFKRIVFLSELNELEPKWNGPLIKDICSTDGVIKRNSLFILETNYFKTCDMDPGLINRFEVFNFTKKYIREQKDNYNSNELYSDTEFLNNMNTNKYIYNLLFAILN